MSAIIATTTLMTPTSVFLPLALPDKTGIISLKKLPNPGFSLL
ncbi:hypothetical protein [Secundilactobacillus pentosiphilus]|nr:hypothetical protein [Secundilactobacillus pentosiphilus]